MNRRCHLRHGWSLIEAVIVITLTALLGGILLPAMLHGLAGHRNLRTEIDMIEAANRLGMQLRHDVRHATTAKIENIPAADIEQQWVGEPFPRQRLVLNRAGQSIIYQVTGDTIDRRKLDSAGKPSREGFRMPIDATHEWELEQQSTARVTLRIDFPGAHPKSRQRKIEIHAHTAREI